MTAPDPASPAIATPTATAADASLARTLRLRVADRAPTTRCDWIDQLRGWAVLVMIEVHVVNAWLLPGIAPSWLVDDLDKVVLPYHLSVPTQIAGRLALGWQQEMADRVEALVNERRRLVERMAVIPGMTVFESGANFVLFRPGAGAGGFPTNGANPVADAGQHLWEALLAKGVLVRNFARWPRTDGCLRVTIGTPEEDDAFLTALEGILGS